MDKMKLAHEYALEMAKQGIPLKSCKDLGWKYADAMQAEAEKRNKTERHRVLFEPKCEVDWRVAPSWAKYWALHNCLAEWSSHKPTVTEDCFLSHGSFGPAPTFSFTGTHIVERPNGF